jgi:hypothetical protein
MTLELPACLLADRVTVGLALVSGLALEAVFTRQPEPVAGAGLLIGFVLLAWQWRRTRLRPRRLYVTPAGAQTEFGPVDIRVPVTGRRARVLGRTVVLHWHGRRGPGPSQGTIWVTPMDLPEESLRALRVALVAEGASRP